MFGRFRPRRQEADQSVRVVVDLDRMLGELPGFKYRGKVYQIRAMDTAVWLRLCEELAALNLLMRKEGFNRKEIRDRYYRLLVKAVDGISFEDVDQMTDAQLGAVVQLIVDCITGRAYAQEGDKKKAPTTPGTPSKASA